MLCIEPPYLHFPFDKVPNLSPTETDQNKVLTKYNHQEILSSTALTSLSSSIVYTPHSISTQEYPALILSKTIRVRNIGPRRTRIKLLPLQPDSHFRLVTNKKGYIYPGDYETVNIEFICTSWKSVQDVFYIESSEMDKMSVQLFAFPALLSLDISRRFGFGTSLVNKSKTKTMRLPNNTDVDFDFQILIQEEQPLNSFSIWPMDGVLRAKSETAVTVTFMPFILGHAQCVFSIQTSQYAFVPIQCQATGDAQLLPQSRILPDIVTHQQQSKDTKKTSTSPLNPVHCAKDDKHYPFHQTKKVPLNKIIPAQVQPHYDNTASQNQSAFDEELNSRAEIQRRKTLCMFVCIGEDRPLETNVNTESGIWSESCNGSRDIETVSSLKCQISVDSPPRTTTCSTVRIQAPTIEPGYVPQISFSNDRPDQRLARLFTKAGWRVIRRIRATKRIQTLKASKGDDPECIPQSEACTPSVMTQTEQTIASIPMEIHDY
ncbi:hypothetical protein BASA50_002840 [Batrachochytrium salamandrivorans]|uniref:MSP domain-containing protein n=1 Tax=Batrachochytrium salamandrivorans TaxID=1357716 RepID=A0ABQ8FN04_9FUNG|nr:hypothetical protein BASA60_008305 [Batrachochytrium salamandrivorans]KAH6572563.1 hypothetical protein BASA62_003314 [Batrachochytrium salamandrivorans]KAH6599643.1 hypothetical protein BASA50_002840 [Batrachochytrium salamandrivorans]KAH9267682.1 hypothetical protein BASA84_000574 [Batrachochytrium salamandrivorans]